MGTLGDLWRQLDPSPLLGDDPRYVDWQHDLDRDDIKPRLIRSIWNSPSSTGSIRLISGPRGAGKSSELRRVETSLRRRVGERQAFVSFLESELFDLDDITATDVSFNMVRQLVNDLRAHGLDLKDSPFHWLADRVKSIGITFDAWGVSVSTALKEEPAKRRQLREVINGELPRIWDQINQVVIEQARAHFKDVGIDRIVILVDDLDKIEQREVRDGFSNLDELFLSDAGKLKALRCDVVLTVPVAYWYSAASTRLIDKYGEVLELGLLPTLGRDGSDGPGMVALRRMLDARFALAGVGADVIGGGAERLDAVVRASGGQLRLVFQALRSAIDRAGDSSTVGEALLDRAMAGQRRTFRQGLNNAHWERLAVTAADFSADTTDSVVAELLRTSRILPYIDDDGDQWYGVHPLLLRAPGVLDR